MATLVQEKRMSPPQSNPPPRADVLGWGTIRAGLALSFFGTLLTLLSPLLLTVVGLLVQEGGTVSVLTAVVIGCGVMGGLTGIVLFVVGACMGCAAPRGSGGRGWGVGACLFGPITLVLLVLLALVGYDFAINVLEELEMERLQAAAETRAAIEGGEVQAADVSKNWKPAFDHGERQGIALTFGGAALLTLICHLMTMRAAAARFGRRDLGLGVVCFLLFTVVYLVGLGVIGFRQQNVSELNLIVGAGIGGFVLLQVWFLVLTAIVRRAISHGLQSVAGAVSSGE